MHSYGVDNQSFRLRILGWIALFAFVVSLQRESLIGLFLTNVPASLHLPKDVSPISFFTIIFTLSFVIYDRLLWTLNPFDKIPNLSGTWVGMATNPYFEPLRLELMQIDQTWTKVSISLEIYEENHFDRGDCLGRVSARKSASKNANDSSPPLEHQAYNQDSLRPS